MLDTEVEVISYERVTNDDGSQMDVAVVQDEAGNQMALVDVDLDSQADAAFADFNSDGQITEEEIINVQDSNIDMHPMMDAADFHSDYAENDIPDYVNDADVDSYMA